MKTHESNVFQRSATGTKPCGCLHPIGAELPANAAQPDLLLLVQIAVFEDYFYLLIPVVRYIDDGFDLRADILPVAADCLADLDHNIEFLCPAFQRVLGLRDHRSGILGSMGKADHCAGLYAAIAQYISAALEVV